MRAHSSRQAHLPRRSPVSRLSHLSRSALALCLGLASVAPASLLVSSPAAAQGQLSEAERKAAARSLFTQGMKEQDAGHAAAALPLFEKAQSIFDAPTHLMHIAQCQVLTGKLVEAAETYETLKRVQLAANAPEVFVQAKTQAEAELPGVRARIPSLKIDLSPKPDGLRGLQVLVNDVLIPVELLGVARPVNPGVAKIVARADGFASTNLDVAIKEKESRSVTLSLTRSAGGPPPVVVPPPGGTATPPPPMRDAPPEQKLPPKGPVSSAGIIVGGHVGGIGVISDTANDNNTGLAGGADFMYRFAKVVLIGATAQVGSIDSVTTWMAAGRISFLTSPEKVAFTAGVLGGARGAGSGPGGTFGGTLGMSIPVNAHFRLEPRMDITATRFDDSRLTPFLFLGVGGYYNHNFAPAPEAK